MKFYQKYDVKVKMRDGVRLSCDVRMPDKNGRYPVILIRTPYNKNIIPDTPRIKHLLRLMEHGYAIVSMDVRGKYESGGAQSLMALEQEGRDGADTVDWILRQRWCDGKVAMTGASYCGFVQIYAAAEHPDGICAITPGVFGNNGFANVVRKNGVPQIPLLVWAICHGSGRVSKTPLVDWQKVLTSVPAAEVALRCGVNNRLIKMLMTNNTDGELWKTFGDTAILDKINSPVLLTGGWYDLYSSSMIDTFTRLSRRPEMRDKVKMVFGPWGHNLGLRQIGELDFGAEAEIDMDWLNTQWIDVWTKGKGTHEDWPAVRIFMMGENKWLESNTWPLSDVTPREMFLSSTLGANSVNGDGILTFDAIPDTGLTQDVYEYDPLNPILTIGGNMLSANDEIKYGPCDQTQMEQRDDMLVFTSAELQSILRIVGEPRLEMYIASSAPDTDFVARLCDVYPDGRSINLCTGICRTRYREGLDREVMMTPGKIHKLEIPLDVSANAFLPGHRIRLEITSSSFPQFMRNHNTGGDNATETKFVTARQTVMHSLQYPSRLILPVLEKT
ncbi:MAG: CocE/NonD family hydrolase [Victivallales bacterium]|nr:CocE/NonD family hydrolase [Victivallales bacterium]